MPNLEMWTKQLPVTKPSKNVLWAFIWGLSLTTQRIKKKKKDPYLHLFQYRVVFNTRKQNPHGIGAVVQEWDTSPIEVIGQLMNVRLQLGKGYKTQWKNKRYISIMSRGESPAMSHQYRWSMPTSYLSMVNTSKTFWLQVTIFQKERSSPLDVIWMTPYRHQGRIHFCRT